MSQTVTAKLRKGTTLEDIQKDRKWLVSVIKNSKNSIQVSEVQVGYNQSITLKITIA